MNINVLSKYIIVFLFAVLVVLSIMLAVFSADNKRLTKDNTRLKEQVALRDTTLAETDKNIKALQLQVVEAEKICNEKLKARNDVYKLLHINPPDIFAKGGSGDYSPATEQKKERTKVENNNEIIDKNKSDYAVNAINSYWVQFTQSSDSEK